MADTDPSGDVRDQLLRTCVRAALRQTWLVRLAARGRPGVDAGLDCQLAAALEVARVAGLPRFDTMDPARARRLANKSMAMMKLPRTRVASVVDTTVGEPRIPLRIYAPHGAGRHWLVYLHGGGGVLGSISTSDAFARYLAVRTGCTVASVDYRLGPEHKHPAAVVDSCAAWDAIAARLPTGSRVGIVGDSFGGFLAAHVERHARVTASRSPDVQVLIYPLVDLTLSLPSVDRLAGGYLLTREIMEWFRDHYSNPDDDHAANSPWYWSSLVGSAPAIVVTAGFDPLVDEGVAWAERLRAAGVQVRHHHHPSLIHSFLSLAGAFDAARAATDRLCAAIVHQLQ